MSIKRSLLVILLLLLAIFLAPSGDCKAQRPKKRSDQAPQRQTKVVSAAPRDGATGVDLDAVLQVHFSTGLTLKTITAESVRLLDARGVQVPAQLGSDLEGDVVNVQPNERLKPRTSYTLEITDRLIDKDGNPVAPFRSTFVTGTHQRVAVRAEGFQFAKTKIDQEQGPTAIAVGPDGHIYVATYEGSLYRLRVDANTGLATGRDKLLGLPNKKILGLAFDPAATASNPLAWITYDERKAENLNVGTFSGVVSQVRIPAAAATPHESKSATEIRYITGLPSGWHPLNGCTFGPDKRLYISVGSMNRLGHDPVRPETPLRGCEKIEIGTVLAQLVVLLASLATTICRTSTW